MNSSLSLRHHGLESVHGEQLLSLSLSGKSEGHVTSGLSLSSGERMEVCIMLAMNTCLEVMSGSTEKGVPW